MPKIKHLAFDKVDWSGWPEPPSEQAYNDWCVAREAHNAAITQSVIKTAAPHITRLSEDQICSPTKALEIACERGWRGIRYQWVINWIRQDQESFSPVSYADNVTSISTREMTLKQEMNHKDWAK